MSGNSFGKLFTVTSCGESHGRGYLGIVDGCPPGLSLDETVIQTELDRRKPGQSRFVTQRKEDDIVNIISGVFEGKTTGTPIGLLIENQDQRSKDYTKIKELFRPGHADYVYQKKYGIRDHRGGGRSSARETCIRVAAGAIAKIWLKEQYNTSIVGYLKQVGDLSLQPTDLSIINTNPFFSADPESIEKLEQYMKKIHKAGESIGARIDIVVNNIPVGWGEPVFDRLDADIAKAMMSINAVKGVEIGDGFSVVSQRGSEHRDEMTKDEFLSNHAGGILGGISTGQPLRVSIALKPTSSIRLPANTVDINGVCQQIVTTGRHDPCVGLRATPIAEAMLALVLIDHALRQRGQNGDVNCITPTTSS